MMSKRHHLAGKLLIAMPSIQGDDFARSVIFMCAHSADGAMGLVINKPAPRMVFADMAEKLKLDHTAEEILQMPVMLGGPMKQFQGFVLHSKDYAVPETLPVAARFGLSTTVDVLQAIAENRGPRHKLLALGYAGWDSGQLESEILRNGWLHCEPDEELVFGVARSLVYDQAMAKLGVDPAMLSTEAGRA